MIDDAFADPQTGWYPTATVKTMAERAKAGP
jgi:hypothetical protein